MVMSRPMFVTVCSGLLKKNREKLPVFKFNIKEEYFE
jgi:hypothetical protein